MKVITTLDFDRWYETCGVKEKALIDVRISKVEEFDYFGKWKYLGDGLSELKWKIGLRVYFAKVGQKIILLINGGKKNAQKKDIKKAKRILQRYAAA